MNLYRTTVDQLVARVLSLQNRNPLSRTYGCLDRNYWHFKTIIDFPSATYQQAVLGLAKLYATQRDDNPYYRQAVIAEAVRSGILYWCRIQHRDGALDEYYENDRSFCPAAFTTFGVAKAFLLARDLFDGDEQKRITGRLLRSARWLDRHANDGIQNQMIASMNALCVVAKLTGEGWVREAFDRRRREVLKAQDEEGWFPEYGGADIGYCFMALDLLCSCLEEENDPELLAAARRLAAFVENFLHPDGTSGGSYGSRCTEHVFPFGVEYLYSKGVQESAPVLAWMRRQAAAGRLIHPAMIDDKYVPYFYFNSYVQAFLTDAKEAPGPAAETAAVPVRHFKHAGVICFRKGDVSGWISVRRNGVCRVFVGDRLVHSDCGYVVRLENGKLAASQCEDPSATVEISEKGETLSFIIRGQCGRVDDSLPLEKWMIPFKLFCKTVLRWGALGPWFNRKLRAEKIAEIRGVPVGITRRFILDREALLIGDELKSEGGEWTMAESRLVRDVTVVHSPSSRFYQTQYLLPVIQPRRQAESGDVREYEYLVSLVN